ncbi:MAG: hypothetical protein IJ514_07035 [Clostridia bacterium]|nr:hypothetical protein [Clostridia bacterium]
MRSKGQGGIILIILLWIVLFFLYQAGQEMVYYEYDAPLYISKEFMIQRNGQGGYIISGQITNSSAETIKVLNVRIIATAKRQGNTSYSATLNLAGFELVAQDTISIYQEDLYIKEELFDSWSEGTTISNSVVYSNISSVVCEVDSEKYSVEYSLMSYREIEENREKGKILSVVAVSGGIIVAVVLILICIYAWRLSK